MTNTVNIHEAKTHLSNLLRRVVWEEEILIAEAGKPIERIVSFEQKPQQRTPGSAQGTIWVAPDFNAPLPEEILAAFEGNSK